MKKTITLLAILYVANIFATDRFVDPNLSQGNGTSIFTTITAAVAAAVNGDRIIVSSSSYNEGELTINKSLKIIPQNLGDVIKFNANIKISGFDAMNFQITGFNLDNYNLLNDDFSGNNNTKANISIINCTFNEIIFDSNYYSLNMLKSKCNSLTFTSGYVINSHIINTFVINDESGSLNEANRKIKIIGNKIDTGILVYNDNFPLLIANNLVMGGLHLKRWNPSNNITNYIQNNNFNGGFHLSSKNVPRYNIIITSNIWESFCVVTSDNGLPYPSHFFDNPDTYGKGFCKDTTDLFPNPNVPGFFEWSYNGGITFTYPNKNDSSPLNIIMIPGESTLSNTGNPKHIYYDIDLTINDIGIYGGPYSQLNYNATNTNNSRAFIFDLEMPVDLFPGENIQIKAKGFHSN